MDIERRCVAFPFSASTFGGSHVSALTLMKALPPLRFRAVAIVHGDGPICDHLEQSGIEWVRTTLPHYVSGQSAASALLQTGIALPGMVRMLRRTGADIIHINDSRMANTWIPAARIAGCKIVLHQRTSFSQSRLLRRNVSSADAIVAISSYVRSTLPNDLQSCSSVVFNPVDEAPQDTNRPSARQGLLASLGERDCKTVVGFVGTLSRQKRPELFVRMAAKLADLRSVLFVMIGRDEDAQLSALTDLARSLGVHNQLRFTGFVHDVANAMAACDVIVCTACNDGFGRIPLEAAFMGTPVVASASGGHLEAIEDGKTGLLVDGDDPSAYAEAVRQLLDDSAKASSLVACATTRARELFSAARHTRAIMDIYEKVLCPT